MAHIDLKETPRVDLELIVDEPPLRVRYAKGEGTTLIISLTGVGTVRTEEPPVELFAASRGGDKNRHVLFVTDYSRSWLNGPNIAERLREVVEMYAKDIGAENIVAIGNSMGGTMALHLSQITSIDTVIAFVPQYSVHLDEMSDEPRWMYFRRQIKDWPFSSVQAVPETTTAYIIHGAAPDECRHLERFPRSHRMKHFVLPEQGHNLAQYLNESSHMARIVERAIAGQPYRVRKAIERAGGISREAFEKKQNKPPLTGE
jgi:pimeloyl-ACP methyl ester carboxylesterase